MGLWLGRVHGPPRLRKGIPVVVQHQTGLVPSDPIFVPDFFVSWALTFCQLCHGRWRVIEVDDRITLYAVRGGLGVTDDHHISRLACDDGRAANVFIPNPLQQGGPTLHAIIGRLLIDHSPTQGKHLAVACTLIFTAFEFPVWCGGPRARQSVAEVRSKSYIAYNNKYQDAQCADNAYH
jgi:hypothetical protein